MTDIALTQDETNPFTAPSEGKVLEAFIGDKAEVFVDAESKPVKPQFKHWFPLLLSFFFLGPTWFFYRKDFAGVAFYFISAIIFGAAVSALMPDSTTSMFGGLAAGWGFAAPQVYLWDARRKVRKIMKQYPHGQWLDRAAIAGGTSVAWGILGFVFMCALIAVAVFAIVVEGGAV